MLKKIAEELERFDASIDVIDPDQAKIAIEAALGAARVLLGAMTVEVFYMSETQVERNKNGTQFSETVPYFLRFAEDLAPNDNDALGKKERKDYNPKADGPWTWSYEKNHVVWIENRYDTTVSKSRDGLPDMDNKAVKEDNIVPAKHNLFWTSVQSVITIPFFYNLGTTFADKNNNNKDKKNRLISYETNGFISFEFKSPKKFNDAQLIELLRMREAVADLIWKSHAWKDSCDGTSHAVKRFAEDCSKLQQDFLPIKTGLFAPERRDHEKFMAPIKMAFTDKKIKMKMYDGESDVLGLSQDSQDVVESIRNVHFAVFDITEKNLVVDMLVGIMFAERKPCLILHENSEPARHPLIRELAVRAGRDTNRLLYLWFYEKNPNGEGYSFFKSSKGERKTWKKVWADFYLNIEEISPTFGIASDSA
jgi:hypothetical protein